MKKLEEDRGRELTVRLESATILPPLDWNLVRSKVKKGIRNATLLAIAPNANIGLVAGTSPGIDPRFTQMFSRNKISGKYLETNPNLITALQKEGVWEKVRDQILEHHGDIESISEIPDHIKRIYKTSFSVSPYAYIEVAARAQKWVDMGISRNMYLDIRDIDEIMKIYSSAWDKGLKTTYYLHMKPRHSAEQSTVSVNKSEAMGKKGFAALREKVAPAVEEAPVVENLTPTPSPIIVPEREPVLASNPTIKKIHISEDPMDQLLCEGCQ
jgi:ribonucleoside-diphosphate reductase alpha chain